MERPQRAETDSVTTDQTEDIRLVSRIREKKIPYHVVHFVIRIFGDPRREDIRESDKIGRASAIEVT
jgi:hypothetical protein